MRAADLPVEVDPDTDVSGPRATFSCSLVSKLRDDSVAPPTQGRPFDDMTSR